LAVNKSEEQKQEEYKNAERKTNSNCLPIGFEDMLLSGTKNSDTQKRERLIQLLESFCPNYWKTVGGWGGGACVTQKRKKSDRREDDLWSAQIFSSSSLRNFNNLQGLRMETKILHDQ
jgi:hypothetical protein